MKRNVADEVKGMAKIAQRCKVDELVVTKQSTSAWVQYPAIEMVRGDYETVLNWCLEHQDEPEFDNDYVNQYVISLAKK